MAHSFFLSYARSDADPYFDRFRRKLAEAVRVKVGGSLDDVAFFDRDSIQPGDEWPERLVSALQHSAVLVPVYSRSFFSSDYCGREWTVFRERQEQVLAAGAPRRPPVIQPVLWVGKADLPNPLPEVARDPQFDHARYGGEYSQIGLRQMMLQSRYRDERRAFILALADRIVDVARKHALPPLAAAPSIQQVKSAFTPTPAYAGGAPGMPGGTGAIPVPAEVTSGPRYVQFIFVAGTRDQLTGVRQQVDCYGLVSGEEWKPYHPDVVTPIVDVALEVAGAERLYTQPLPLGADLMQRLDEAERQDKLVAIIVDTWTLRLPEYHAFMREYDRRSFLNCVVLVPWNPAHADTAVSRAVLEDAIRATFPSRTAMRDPKTFVDSIASTDELRRSLAMSLAAARARVISAAEVRRRAESKHVFVKPIISATAGV